MTDTTTTEATEPEVETKPERINPYPIEPLEKMTVPGIHRAMFAVKFDAPAIAKAGELTLGSNTVAFTKVEDIRKALYPLFAKHGIMLYLHRVSSNGELQVAAEAMTMAQFYDELDGEGKKTGRKILDPSAREIRDGKIPTTRHWASVVYDLRFVFVGDGSEVIVTTEGFAYDTNSDKALGKATTAAIKRALAETFDIVDEKEVDPDETTGDEGNRAKPTDSREGGDRGQQQRAAAQTAQTTGTSRRSGPQRSGSTAASPAAARSRVEAQEAADETGAEPTTGEIPSEDAPPAEPALSRLDIAKQRVQAANRVLKLESATIDAIATSVTGYKDRNGENGWLTKVTVVEKLATELEARVQEVAQ